MAITLDGVQYKAMRELAPGKILCGDVGSGKSIVAVAYFYIVECGGRVKLNGLGENLPPTDPKSLYIITTARKRDSLDWQKELAQFGLSTDRKSSMSHIHVVVDSWNNISKHKEVRNAFFIFDEQRLVGKGAWVKSFKQISKNNRWILLSATPGDTWLDYIPVFCANGFYKNRTEFMQRHVVYSYYGKYPKVDRYLHEDYLNRLRDLLLVEMPVVKTTVRHSEWIFVEHDADNFNTCVRSRWNPYTQEPMKDVSELFRVLRRVVNSDAARLDALEKVWEKHHRVIVFYNFDYELHILREFCKEKLPPWAAWSEWNGHKHEEVPEGDEWLYLVQYTSGSEAWNCVRTDCILFYSLNYSYKLMEQAKGRIDRRNTPYVDLWYYTLRSRSKIDVEIIKALREKRTFNEKSVTW